MTEKTYGGGGVIYRFGPFRLEVGEHRLLKNEAPVYLSAKAFDLALALLRPAGRLKTREELIETLWPDTIVEEANLTWNVNALRRALEDNRQNPRYIETVHKSGYRFIAPVEVTDEPRKPSVAVLPFENLSGESECIYLTSGIQATILSKLAGIEALRVISHTSTARYSSHPVDLKKLVTQLGVTAVLEGSVQKIGGQVLINVRLIDVESNDHIWAQAYTRLLTDVFAVENDVATHVSAALKARLLPNEMARLSRTPTQDSDAYLIFLKADYYARQITVGNNTADPEEAMNQAVTLYREATDHDPGFALAWARLSYLLSYAYWREIVMTPGSLASAAEAAEKALVLQPDSPETQLAMGYVEYYVHKNYKAALARFEQVRRQVPNDVDVNGAIAFVYSRQGRWKESLETLRQATACDPRNPRWPYGSGITLMELRRYAEAERQFDLALAIEPKDYDAVTFKAMSLLHAGKSLSQARELLTDVPHHAVQTDFGSALKFEIELISGQPDAALETISSTGDWISAADAVGQEPTSLLRAEAWDLHGDRNRARQDYRQAVNMLKKALRERPEEASLWAFLGLAEAGLQRKPEAIRAGVKATSLLPVGKDSVYGPSYLATLAKIYVRVGENDQALKLISELLPMPAGWIISVPMLRRDPVWDPIRKDPRFQALLKEYENKVPLPDLDVTGILSPIV